MTVLVESDGRVFETVSIELPSDFTCPFTGEVFPCLLWDHGSHFTEKERSAVARALLESGCRYVLCGGEDPDAWHIAVDLEFVELHMGEPASDRDTSHVMTTSHEGEKPDDVAFMFVLNTNFDYHDFHHYLVLHVGSSDMRERVNAAVREFATQ